LLKIRWLKEEKIFKLSRVKDDKLTVLAIDFLNENDFIELKFIDDDLYFAVELILKSLINHITMKS
jgi:hypothetical protein